MATVPDSARRIAIIGAGYSGMACAVELVRGGQQVVVLEAGRVLGGRARRVELHGLRIDNGQHLLIGAYRELLGLIDWLHRGQPAVYARRPLQLLIDGGARLELPDLPAPLDSLVGLLAAGGLRWRDKLAAALLMQRLKRNRFAIGPDQPLEQWLLDRHQPRALIRALWEPLCLAALNTPLAEASAQVFVNVLRDSLLGGRGAGDLILPAVDLAALFPEPAARWLQEQGSEVRTGQRVVQLEQTSSGWLADGESFDAVVLAVGPHHAAPLLRPHDAAAAATIEAMRYQSISTLWLQYDARVRLAQPMLGLGRGIAQWVFDRGQLSGEQGLLAVVISVDGPHLEQDRDELTRTIVQELQQACGVQGEPLWSQLIIERRATFACTAGLVRPTAHTSAAGLWLAGDYVAGDYPATLEGAVRSGRHVAARILGRSSS